MAEISRLTGRSEWIDMEFVERERTPEPAMKIGIQSQLAGLSLSNTVSLLADLDVERSRKAVHDWMQKADLQPIEGKSPNHVALDETVIRISSQQYWLYAACDPETNQLLHVRLFPTATTVATQIFLRELREKHSVESAVFLVDGAQHLQTALSRAGLRFHPERHGNRNTIERIFRELKRRTSSFSNCFSHVFPETAENWLQAFACWLNAPNLTPPHEHPEHLYWTPRMGGRTMLRDSFWYPNTARGAAFLLAVLGMIGLHQSEFLGLMDSTRLMFGWLPLQIAYDMAFNLVGVAILYAMYRAAPSPPEALEPSGEDR